MSNESAQRDADPDEMNENTAGLSRASAERLLDGGEDRDFARLSAVLRAAAAPARIVELDGMSAAVAAFAGAGTAVPRPRSAFAIAHAAASRLLAVKLALATASVAVGGVALAAAAGVLPVPSDEQGHSRPPAMRVSPARDGGGANQAAVPSSPDAVSPCRAWINAPGAAAARATDPAYRSLIVTAGGPDAVDRYCALLLPGAEALSSDPSSPPDGEVGSSSAGSAASPDAGTAARSDSHASPPHGRPEHVGPGAAAGQSEQNPKHPRTTSRSTPPPAGRPTTSHEHGQPGPGGNDHASSGSTGMTDDRLGNSRGRAATDEPTAGSGPSTLVGIGPTP